MTSKEGDKEKSASSAQGGSKGAAAEQTEGAAGAGRVSKKAGAAPARSAEPVYQPTPSTGMKLPDGAPAPNPDDDKRDQSGYERSTPTDQAKRSYSIQQTEDKVRCLIAELTGMHVKNNAALWQVHPEGIVCPAEAANLGPSTANCMRSALGAQEALVESVIADLEELASKGSPNAAIVFDSSQPDVQDRAMYTAIKNGAPKVGLGVIEAMYGDVLRRPGPCRPGSQSVGAKRLPQAQQYNNQRNRGSTARGRRGV